MVHKKIREECTPALTPGPSQVHLEMTTGFIGWKCASNPNLAMAHEATAWSRHHAGKIIALVPAMFLFFRTIRRIGQTNQSYLSRSAKAEKPFVT